MKTKTFKLAVGWTTEYFPGDVENVVLELDESDIEKILKHRQYLKDNPDLYKVVQSANAEFLDSEGEETDFRTEGPDLFIFKERVYIYAQSKYDASTQIESESLDIEDIINAKFNEDEKV